MTNKTILDVTSLPPKEKHPTIFQLFEDLLPNDSYIISNDHDPKPLYYQLLAEKGNTFTWRYIENGPEIWVVEIGKRPYNNDETIASLSKSDSRKLTIFKSFNIDFSCGGHKTLLEVCKEQELDISQIKKALNNIDEQNSEYINYSLFTKNQLIEHILQKHHQYIKKQSPAIKELVYNIRNSADTPSGFNSIAVLIFQLIDELEIHLHKEELIVFPFIQDYSMNNGDHNSKFYNSFDKIQTPINMMRLEHESGFELLSEIKKRLSALIILHSNSETIKQLNQLIIEFEDDLLLHVHLENNILFESVLNEVSLLD